MFFIASVSVDAQSDLTSFDHFEIKNDDVLWQYLYKYPGSIDSLRPVIVHMLRSKYFTSNVIRNEIGYTGEIHHYEVDCKKYERSFSNTPLMYWSGEWSGKFILRIAPGGYQVTVYALYYEKPVKERGYFQTEKLIRGRYLNAVTDRKRKAFRQGELKNLELMSISLFDSFDIRNAEDLLK
jgi:hypothetical protein